MEGLTGFAFTNQAPFFRSDILCSQCRSLPTCGWSVWWKGSPFVFEDIPMAPIST